MPVTGKVYFVGAGPGDRELLTLRALRLLVSCDTVIYDSLITDDIMAIVPERVEKIAIRPSPREKGMSVDEIGSVAGQKALQGRTVVRLKSGDPLVFSRIGEEMDCLNELGVEYEIVPGISSVFYSAAASGTMLTDRRFSSSFAVVTAHEAKKKQHSSVDWEMLARSVDVIVVLMGASNMPDYCRKLRDAGVDGRCAVSLVGNASRKDQVVSTITLDEACDGQAQVPSDLCTVIISRNKIATAHAIEIPVALFETA